MGDQFLRYDIMRLFLMFDLPMQSKADTRNYRHLISQLEREGFVRFQYSVFTRVCPSRLSAKQLLKRLKRDLSFRQGKVASLIVTEKQFHDIQYLVGNASNDFRNSADRIIIL